MVEKHTRDFVIQMTGLIIVFLIVLFNPVLWIPVVLGLFGIVCLIVLMAILSLDDDMKLNK